jgi:hypothetical protein
MNAMNLKTSVEEKLKENSLSIEIMKEQLDNLKREEVKLKKDLEIIEQFVKLEKDYGLADSTSAAEDTVEASDKSVDEALPPTGEPFLAVLSKLPISN